MNKIVSPIKQCAEALLFQQEENARLFALLFYDSLNIIKVLLCVVSDSHGNVSGQATHNYLFNPLMPEKAKKYLCLG